MKLEPAKPFEKKSELMKKVGNTNLAEKAPLPPIPAKPKEKEVQNKNSTAYQVINFYLTSPSTKK